MASASLLSRCSKCGQHVSEGPLPVCLECGDVSMCKGCIDLHHQDPRTEHHTVTGTCEVPGHEDMPLELFCRVCGCPVCARCHGSHKTHELEQHSVVIAEEQTTLKTVRTTDPSSLQPEKADLLKTKDEKKTRKDDGIKYTTERFDAEEGTRANDIHELCNIIYEHDQEMERHEGEEEKYRSQTEHHRRKVGYHRTRMEHHLSEVERTEREMKHHGSEAERHRIEKERRIEEKVRKIEDTERLGRERENAVKKIEEDYQKDCIEINAGIKRIAELQKEVKDILSRKDELVAERILRPGLYKEIKEIQERLREMGGAAGGRGERTGEAAGDSGQGGRTGGTTWEGGNPVTTRRYSTGNLVYNLRVPWDFKFGFDVDFVTSDCIVSCGNRETGGELVSELRMWRLPATTLTVGLIMEDRNCQFKSVAALGEVEVAVLATKAPIIRIVNINTKAVEGIDVNIKTGHTPRWLAVDRRGHFIITESSAYNTSHVYEEYLLLVDRNGTILQFIQTRGRGLSQNHTIPTFCRKRGMSLSCSERSDLIVCHKLQDDTLTEVMKTTQGVDGFQCCDICSGSAGEIFIFGILIQTQEFRVYQVDIDTEKKTVEMNEIKLDRYLKKRSTLSLTPRCAFHGTTLAITLGRRIHAFQLRE